MADDNERSPSQQQRRKNKIHPLCARNSQSCRKLLFFIYVLVYLLSGLALLSIGVFVEVERRELSGLEKYLALPTAILIFIGLVVSINGLCGCVGVLEENIVLLKLFFGFSIITLLCQIGLAVLVYFNGKNAHNTSRAYWAYTTFYGGKFNINFELQQAMDNLQVKYRCCGLESSHDYEQYLDACKQTCHYGDDTATPPVCENRCTYPVTCCKDTEAYDERVVGESRLPPCTFLEEERKTALWSKGGCLGDFFDWIIERLTLIGATAFGLALPQVVGLVWTFFVLRKIKEYHSWYTVDLANENENETL